MVTTTPCNLNRKLVLCYRLEIRKLVYLECVAMNGDVCSYCLRFRHFDFYFFDNDFMSLWQQLTWIAKWLIQACNSLVLGSKFDLSQGLIRGGVDWVASHPLGCAVSNSCLSTPWFTWTNHSRKRSVCETQIIHSDRGEKNQQDV